MPTALLAKYPLDIDIGTQTLLYELPPIDYSWADGLRVIAVIDDADTESGDILSVYLQARVVPGLDIWDTRVRLREILGDEAATAANPACAIGNVEQWGTLADAEEAYIPTGSLGGTELAAGAVRNGLFPGKGGPTAAGPAESMWRLKIVLTEATTENANFEGTIYVYANAAA